MEKVEKTRKPAITHIPQGRGLVTVTELLPVTANLSKLHTYAFPLSKYAQHVKAASFM